MKTTQADRLIEHMRTCKTCLGAKVANTPHFCATGKRLIKLTVEERHG